MSVAFHMVEITPAHATVLAAMHGEAFAAPWDESAFASALDQPGAVGFIAAQDGDEEPLGFALLRVALFEDGGGEAEVLTIATRPSAQRRGVAARLMNAALAQVRALGADQVFLEVAEDNQAARMLYESLGFWEVARRDAYYARGEKEPVDAIVMTRDFKI